MSGRSLSFDRAADVYDATREISPDQLAANIDILTKEIQDREPVLEVGIGTGRIGLPFAATGRRLIGFDLSMRMLDKLRRKSETLPVVQADATSMPFRNDTFGSAYAMWVLHLIADWPDALREMRRVVRPGGVVLVTIGGIRGFNQGPWEEMIWDLREATGIDENLGANSLEEIDSFMDGEGLPGRDAGEWVASSQVAPAEMIRRIRENIFSFTWELDEKRRLEAADIVERKARDRYGDLDRPRANGFVTRWRAYDIT